MTRLEQRTCRPTADRGGRPGRARWLAAAMVAAGLVLSGCTAAGRSALSASSPGSTSQATDPAGAPSVDTSPTSTTPASSTPTSSTPITSPPASRPTTPPTTSAPTATVPAQPGLRPGSNGPAVAQLQQSLSSLGYWLGPIDGGYGNTTTQAVVALQKAAGLPRSGIVDPSTAAALAAGTKPKPQSASGHVIEVDLAHQLLLLVTNGHLDAVLNTSTGGGYRYTSQGVTSVAVTPVGHYTTNWEVNGTRVSPLGVLWRPKFFVGGIAIHGDSSVPSYPASHGCVRVSNEAIDWIWATGSDPIGTSVWVR